MYNSKFKFHQFRANIQFSYPQISRITTLNPQACLLRKARMCVNIGVAQEKATQT